jgi:uncharacterized protein (TIGR03067 family)
MTRALVLIACWIAGGSLALALGQKPDAAADLKAMVGKWKIEKAEMAGMDATAFVKDVTLEIGEGGKYTVLILGQKDVGTVTIDPTKKPAEMDIKGTDGPNKGKTIKTIYKLDGDTLVVCYELGDGDRPAKFEAKANTQRMLATYKREKK